jgi:hypothetical protein
VHPDRNVDVQLFTRPDLEKIDVQNVRSRRMVLDFADQRLRRSDTLDLQIDDRVFGIDLSQQQLEVVGVDRQGPALLTVPVRDRGNLPRSSQLASDALARTRPESRFQCCHFLQTSHFSLRTSRVAAPRFGVFTSHVQRATSYSNSELTDSFECV